MPVTTWNRCRAASGAPSDIAVAVDRLVTDGLKSLADYEASTRSGRPIVKKASVAALDQHTALARLAVEETGRGLFGTRPRKHVRCEHARTAWAG